MCGIVTAWHVTGGESIVCRALSEIAHRGTPQARNETATWGTLTMGANRLPITTSASACQPYVSDSGRLRMVYNGEVYGLQLEAPSDAAALLQRLDRIGHVAIETLNGMFACIWHDAQSDCIFAARDHIGIKPLYYAFAATGVLFSSEIKALALLDVVDEICEVPSGTVLRFDYANGRVSLPSRISEFNLINQSHASSNVSASELRELLVNAISLRVESAPGPVGVYLSGGIDSGAIYAIAVTLRDDIVAIVGGKRGQPDHDSAVRLVAELDGRLCAQEIPVEASLFARYGELVRITESYEPNMIRQSAAYYSIVEAGAEAGCKVVLCGEGADELFCGYPDFQDNAIEDWQSVRLQFLQDLRRTQLQRVDRISMHFTTEVRVPYLDKRIVRFALSHQSEESFFFRSADRSLNKLLLREALNGIAPGWLLKQPKIVLSEGCGLRGNHPTKGMFYDLASRQMPKMLMESICRTYPDWTIRTPEEALYFETFAALKYTKARVMQHRPRTNVLHST